MRAVKDVKNIQYHLLFRPTNRRRVTGGVGMTNGSYPALTKRQAEVYYLHKVKGLKHKQIAEKLTKKTGENITWQTSRTLYYRACRALEKMEATLESAKGKR